MATDLSRARADRVAAVQEVEAELEAWRVRAVPDRSAPLEAEDIARLVRDCLHALALDGAVDVDFSVNTVHYYRRKNILDAPEGRTSAARYALRHVWQAVGARLAGQLGLLTLAEARHAMRDESEAVLATFVAERVVDARARQAVRRASAAPVNARPLAPTPSLSATDGVAAMVLRLPGDAWCVVPNAHPARRSAAAARALVRAFADALIPTES